MAQEITVPQENINSELNDRLELILKSVTIFQKVYHMHAMLICDRYDMMLRKEETKC